MMSYGSEMDSEITGATTANHVLVDSKSVNILDRNVVTTSVDFVKIFQILTLKIMNNPNVGNFQNNPDEFDPEPLYFTFRPNDYETTTSESLNFENAIHPNVNPMNVEKLNFENDMMNQSSVNLMNTEILNNSNFG